MADWSREVFGLPTVIGNDSDLAGLAEAGSAPGRGRIVFYSNVGSGIGGGTVVEGDVYPGGSGIASGDRPLEAGDVAGSRMHRGIDGQRLDDR